METRLVAYNRLGTRRGVLPSALEITPVVDFNELATLSIHYPVAATTHAYLQNDPEVAFEFHNGTAWVEPYNCRFILSTVDFDYLEEVPTRRYDFIGIGESLRSQTVYDAYGLPLNDEGKVQFKLSNAGQIVKTVWDNAVARGWSGYTIAGGPTADANGTAWPNTLTISYSVDSSIDDILHSLVNSGMVDYVWNGRQLRLYVPNSPAIFTDHTLNASAKASFIGSGESRGIDAAPEMLKLNNLATHVIVHGENGLRWVFPTGAVIPDGRREVVLSYSGVDDEGTARILADPVILKSQNVLKNTTRQFHLVNSKPNQLLPFLDYGIGHWAWINRDGGRERMRIISISLTINERGVQGFITFGDKIDDLLSSMYKKIQSLSGNVANESAGLPPELSRYREPSRPTALVVTPVAYTDAFGQTKAQVNLSWAHDGKDVNAQAIDIVEYRAFYRLYSTQQWIRLFATPDKSGSYSPLEALKPDGTPQSYEFGIQAVGPNDIYSHMSVGVVAEMPTDTTPPPKPSPPVVTTTLRTVNVRWDGTGRSLTNQMVIMPNDFSHVVVWESTSSDMTNKTNVASFSRADFTTLGTRTADTTYYYQMTAFDRVGNQSDPSDVVSITPQKLISDAELSGAIDSLTDDIGANVTATEQAQAAANAAQGAATAAAEAAQTAYERATSEADRAKAEALIAAANTAQTKADQAKADAIAAAASDAQAKADAARVELMKQLNLSGKTWIQDAGPAAGTTYKWSGTDSNSASIKELNFVEQLRNLVPNPGFETHVTGWGGQRITRAQSSVWAKNGTKSMELTRTSDTATDAYADFTPVGGFTALKPNTKYTIFGWYYLPVPFSNLATDLEGTALNQRLSIFVHLNATTIKMFTGKNSTGERRVGGTFTTPAVFTGYNTIRVYAGGAPGEKIYWDSIIMVEGEYTSEQLDYFDGGTPDDRENDLWINTTAGANTPNRWNTQSHLWNVITDSAVAAAAQKATDAQGTANSAASAASAAQEKANTAFTNAQTAQDAADAAADAAASAASAAAQALSDAAAAAQAATNAAGAASAANDRAIAAQTSVDGKVTVSVNAPTAGDLANKPANALWTRIVGGVVVGNWYKAAVNSPGWTPMPFDPVLIPQIQIGTGTVGTLDGVRITARTIGARELIIGDYQNYFIDGGFEQVTTNTTTAPHPMFTSTNGRHTLVTTSPFEGVYCLQAAPGTGTASSVLSLNLPVLEGETYLFRFRAKRDAAYNGDGNSKLRMTNQAGTLRTNIVYPLSAMPTADVWQKFEVVFTVPAGDYRMQGQLWTTNTAGNIWFDDFELRRMNAGELLVDGDIKTNHLGANSVKSDKIDAGAVTAQKLEAVLALVNKIVAGPINGTHAEMDATGFHVFANDPIDGIPNEVARLGVAGTDDYLSIYKANGDLAASMSQDGGFNGQSVTTNQLIIAGSDFNDIIWEKPWGHVGSAQRTNQSLYNATAGSVLQPYLRFDCELQEGRLYRISTSAIKMACTDPGTARLHLHAAVDGVANTSTNVITYADGNKWEGNALQLMEMWTPTLTNIVKGRKRACSFLISFASVAASGAAGIRANINAPARLLVEDMGPLQATYSGVWLDGSSQTSVPTAPPAQKVTYTRDYVCNSSMNYKGDNTQYLFDTGNMYQGLSPAGMGNLKSIGCFPSMTGDLSGSTINWMRIIFDFKHWYYNAGGTARIGIHGHAAPPGTFSSSTQTPAMISGGWPKPGARWVDVPSVHWSGFISGVNKGFTLEGDGTYQTYGYSVRPTLQINFTK